MIDSNGDYSCRVSRKVYWKVYLFLLIFAGVIVAGYIYNMPPTKNILIGFGVSLVIGIKFTELHRLKRSYKIAHDKLTYTKGILGRSVKTVYFPTISDVSVKQNFFQKIFNFGDVVISRYKDTEGSEFKNINSPYNFVNFLHKKMSNFDMC